MPEAVLWGRTVTEHHRSDLGRGMARRTWLRLRPGMLVRRDGRWQRVGEEVVGASPTEVATGDPSTDGWLLAFATHRAGLQVAVSSHPGGVTTWPPAGPYSECTGHGRDLTEALVALLDQMHMAVAP